MSRNRQKTALEDFKSAAQDGILRYAVPTHCGGCEGSFLDMVKVHERLGFSSKDTGLVLAINAHLWGTVFPVLKFGTHEQISHWFPALVNGQAVGGHAITEPDAGSDIQSMTTTACIKGKEFVLNGRKRYITNTPIADVLVVYAKESDTGGISAFLVSPDDSGVEFTGGPTVRGCDSATMGDVVLQECNIPSHRRLGRPGAGATMIQIALERERAFIFAGITGIMSWQLQAVTNYVKSRQFRKYRLSEFQAVSHKIADMKLRYDTARLWIEHCAILLDAGKRITIASAEAKLYASEAFLQSCLDSVHLMGAHGLEGEMVSLVNDAMAGRLMSGSSEIQKNILAAMQGLKLQG